MKQTKRFLSLFLALVLCLGMTACGKSEAVKNTEALINAIGSVHIHSGDAISAAQTAYNALTEEDKAAVENYAILTTAKVEYTATLIDQIGFISDEVTLDSESYIVAAEEAYAVLSDEEKAMVENYDDLTVARTALEEAKELAAYTLSFAGTWVSEMNPDERLQLTEDALTYQLSLSADRSTLSDGFYEYAIIEEDGFTKLVSKSDYFDACCYVRQEDYQAAFDQKFLAVELTAENVKDYLGDPVLAGYTLDTWGEKTDRGVYILTSKVYENGWVYVGCSEDFAIDIIYQTGFTHTCEGSPFSEIDYVVRYPVRIGDRVKGTLYYVRSEYVAENYMIQGTTKVRLTSGAEYNTGRFGGSYGVSFNYEDFIH